MYKEIIKEFYDNKNEESSYGMSAYMKGKFLFLGIKKPVRGKLQGPFLKECKKEKCLDWDSVNTFYSLPEREFQYLAVDYLIALKSYILPEDMNKIEKLIVNKSWWDTVDSLASNIVGELCKNHPELIPKFIVKWSEADNMWLRRSSILFQLKYKGKTDERLLGEIIRKNLESNEFFINKAIGWVLREYSKTNKEWVGEFMGSNSLSHLSVREGSKYL